MIDMSNRTLERIINHLIDNAEKQLTIIQKIADDIGGNELIALMEKRISDLDFDLNDKIVSIDARLKNTEDYQKQDRQNFGRHHTLSEVSMGQDRFKLEPAPEPIKSTDIKKPFFEIPLAYGHTDIEGIVKPLKKPRKKSTKEKRGYLRDHSRNIKKRSRT